MSLVRDERGNLSSARALLYVWTLILAIGFLADLSGHAASNAAWAVGSSVQLALISWAAGPRIAQYLGPQIGAMATGIGPALREKIVARRDPTAGYEKSGKVPKSFDDAD